MSLNSLFFFFIKFSSTSDTPAFPKFTKKKSFMKRENPNVTAANPGWTQICADRCEGRVVPGAQYRYPGGL